jgi:hypothetical protein
MHELFDRYRRGTPGDNGRTPLEVLAAEQRILSYADALVTWMQKEENASWSHSPAIDGFITHQRGNPLTGDTEGKTIHMVLDKLDPDTNRFFLELLRAAWERRCWQAHHGLRATPHE